MDNEPKVIITLREYNKLKTDLEISGVCDLIKIGNQVIGRITFRKDMPQDETIKRLEEFNEYNQSVIKKLNNQITVLQAELYKPKEPKKKWWEVLFPHIW